MDNSDDSDNRDAALPKVVIEEEVIEMRGVTNHKIPVLVRRPHQHAKHNIGILLQGSNPNGIQVDRVQLWLCPGCKLAWFEDLEPVFPQLIKGPQVRSN